MTPKQVIERARELRAEVGQRWQDYFAAVAAERALVDEGLLPLAEPVRRRPKILRSFVPSAEEGRALARDVGFDLAVLEMPVNVPDPKDAALVDQEYRAALVALWDEQARRDTIARARLSLRGVRAPALTSAHSLSFFIPLVTDDPSLRQAALSLI